ncbi:hypothetical protein ANSO36C_11070 [Nostoc cf. commune SO-36]|uniref:Uncharacterized protein n=1 Tax=Nostoc cf. commune SO-36 TaxID=449208 RepID=A0ABM7YXB3_NOSCO|nr:hypothetical protein [Nostoc commune]BDI15305.1 hypothetical protein ANSO36C_11070 [Nostoc cf. commune SO-36]
MSSDKPLTLLLCETLRERCYRFSRCANANANASTPKNCTKALPQIITRLKQQGYRFVTILELPANGAIKGEKFYSPYYLIYSLMTEALIS